MKSLNFNEIGHYLTMNHFKKFTDVILQHISNAPVSKKIKQEYFMTGIFNFPNTELLDSTEKNIGIVFQARAINEKDYEIGFAEIIFYDTFEEFQNYAFDNYNIVKDNLAKNDVTLWNNNPNNASKKN